jgi:hypothetical protein
VDKYCLNLLCAPESEERLLDLLLESAMDRLFTTSRAYSHGAEHSQLSNLEQVMGRSRSVLVQVLLNRDELEGLLAQLVQSFAGVGLAYWATPVALQGEIK